MTSGEANVGCVRFYCDMLSQSVIMLFLVLLVLIFALVFGYVGFVLPVISIPDPNGSISALWIMVPYFCMTVSGPIWYCLDENRHEARIQERVAVGSIQEMVTAERHQDQQRSVPRVIVID
jgi:hypothetical protein